MYVVFIHGPPAAGKYTVGELVAEKLGIPLFHNHLTVDLVGTLFEFGTPEFVAMREKVWLDGFAAAAESGQSFVFTFNPETTVAQETLDRLEKAVTGNAGRVFYVELKCDEEEIEKRLTRKSREEFGKLTDLDLYRQLRSAGAFDEPVLPPALVTIDTSENPPAATAKVITDAVNAAAK
ncbi:MAG: AAA family ATPase [Pyrinomonadaceae bacterium]|nr:AAA family ATPase [Pyrinomonadaceae bacterium]